MGKISVPLSVSNVTDWQSLRRFCSIFFTSIIDELNGRLTFSENINTATVTMEFTAPNQELRFDHTLERIASNYILIKTSVDARLFDGSTENVKNSSYIKCTAAATVTVLIF